MLTNDHIQKMHESDMLKSSPIISWEELEPFYRQWKIRSGLSSSDNPKVIMNLDYLALMDYSDAYALSDQDLRDILALIENSRIYDSHEIIELAVQSLVFLIWSSPESQQDIDRIPPVEFELWKTSKQISKYIFQKHKDLGVKLPPWARIAYLEVLNTIPDAHQSKELISSTPCILLRSCNVNAYTFPLKDRKAIVMDYALEPFLRSINRMFGSFFFSRNFAGPKRVERALYEFLPYILFLKGVITADKLHQMAVLFDQGPLKSILLETNLQIRFLVLHELGHILLHHPGQKSPVQLVGPNSLDLEEHDHLLEYEADMFAVNWIRSTTLNQFRYFLNPKIMGENYQDIAHKQTETLEDFALQINAVETLFLIMDFADRYYTSISKLFPDLLSSRNLNSHPPAISRSQRIRANCQFDMPLRSEYISYIQQLLEDVSNHIYLVPSNELKGRIKSYMS